MEAFETKLDDRIQISVEHNGDLSLLSNLLHTIEDAAHARTRSQCSLGGELIHDAVGQRI